MAKVLLKIGYFGIQTLNVNIIVYSKQTTHEKIARGENEYL